MWRGGVGVPAWHCCWCLLPLPLLLTLLPAAGRMAALTTDYAAQKEREFRTACGYFGIRDVRILGFRDKQFRKSDDAVNAVR